MWRERCALVQEHWVSHLYSIAAALIYAPLECNSAMSKRQMASHTAHGYGLLIGWRHTHNLAALCDVAENAIFDSYFDRTCTIEIFDELFGVFTHNQCNDKVRILRFVSPTCNASILSRMLKAGGAVGVISLSCWLNPRCWGWGSNKNHNSWFQITRRVYVRLWWRLQR